MFSLPTAGNNVVTAYALYQGMETLHIIYDALYQGMETLQALSTTFIDGFGRKLAQSKLRIWTKIGTKQAADG
jgi:hypothetical protein